MASDKKHPSSPMVFLGGATRIAAQRLKKREIEQREMLDEAEGRLGVNRKKKEKARD